MTRRGRRQRDEEWTCKFSKLLRLVVESNNIKLDHLDSDAGILLSAFRTWVSGRNLPGPSYFNLLLSFIAPRVSDSSGPIILERVFSDCSNTQAWDAVESYSVFEGDMQRYIPALLEVYWRMGRKMVPLPLTSDNAAGPSGKTVAVVFDFVGTLLPKIDADSSLRYIWLESGQDKARFQNILAHYSHDADDRRSYFQQATELFMEARITKDDITRIGNGTRLIPGICDVFKVLNDAGVLIWIVSRSERQFIRAALGDLACYVEEIKSNQFLFDSEGVVDGIRISPFDYEGKRRFVSRVAGDLSVSPQDIVFVGNSNNDASVRGSGAVTVCVSPSNTTGTDRSSWTHCCQCCDDLRDILPFINLQSTTK